MAINGDMLPNIVATDMEDFVVDQGDLHKNNSGMNPKAHHFCSRTIDMRNSLRKRSAYEGSELFDKVKRQLSNYLDKVDNGRRSPIVPKDVQPKVAGLPKRPHKYVYNSLICSSLNIRERSLLKFLMKNEDSTLNRYVFLTKTLQQHLLQCLETLTKKVEGKIGLVDVIKKCPLIHSSRSTDRFFHDGTDRSQVYNIVTTRDICVGIIHNASHEGRHNVAAWFSCSAEFIRVAEKFASIPSDEIVFVVNSELCSPCSVAVVTGFDYEWLVLEEDSLLNCEGKGNAGRLAPLEGGMKTVRFLTGRSAEIVLRTHFTFYYLETINEACLCEEDIFFSYQPNPYNHLLHLYLGLNHESD